MLTAWIADVALVIYGIVGSLDSGSGNQASKSMYKLRFNLSFCMGGMIYYTFCLVWPVRSLPRGWKRPLVCEELAANEQFYDHENAG